MNTFTSRFGASFGGADNSRGSFAAALATLFLSLLFTACGGGGGGGSTGGGGGSCTNGATNYPTCNNQPVDAAATVAVTPADGASAVKRDAATVTITPNVTAGTYNATTTTGLVCGGKTIVAGDKGVLTGQVLKLAPDAALLPSCSDKCTAQGQVSVNGVNGGKQLVLSWKTTFDIEACAWWPPTVTPMGIKVTQSELKQLPAGCLSFTDSCFKDFVASGKAKVVATTQTMLGLANADEKRPIVTVGYLTPSGKPQLTMFFADTGEPAVTDKIDVNTREPFDWMFGNELGYLWKRTSDGTCFQWKWFYSPTTGKGLFWSNEIVSCPL